MEAPQPHRRLVCRCDEVGAAVAEDAGVDDPAAVARCCLDSGGCVHGSRAATSVAVGVGETGVTDG